MNRYAKTRFDSVVALLILVSLSLGCGMIQNLASKNPTEEANKLVRSARDDLADVDRIAEDNDDLVSRIQRADNARNSAEVRKLLGEAVEAIDKGLEAGENAADKIDKASKLDVDSTYKEYLSLKAQAFKKQIDAFKERKRAAEVMRDNYGKGGSAESQAKEDFRKANENFRKLLTEARDLHRKADDIARRNPDKIKS